MPRLLIQSILYEHSEASIEKLLEGLRLNRLPEEFELLVLLGDCSSQPRLTEESLVRWSQSLAQSGISFRYTFFGENLGPTKGHNRLYFSTNGADRLLLINPTCVAPFHLLERLNRLADSRADWGAIEARQIPLEHPKEFDPRTLETCSLISTCALCHAPSFEALNGFDESFFLYGQDIDLGWRLRALGRRLYYGLDTFVHVPRELTLEGLSYSPAEKVYMPLTNLILWRKYGQSSRIKEVEEYLVSQASDPTCSRILSAWHEVRGQIVPAKAEEVAIANASFGEDGSPYRNRWGYKREELLA